MKVIILGCGRVGSTLASSLSKDGHDVMIIDRKSSAFRRLSPGFKGATLVGNGVDESVLKRAGIEQADAFMALTQGDNTNLMSVQIAKEIFQVPKAIARVYDPIRAVAYQELGVDTFCSTLIAARLLKDRLLDKELGGAATYCELAGEEALV
ncbi:MAG: potassium channel family protein [Armatimonadota bacterium]